MGPQTTRQSIRRVQRYRSTVSIRIVGIFDSLADEPSLRTTAHADPPSAATFHTAAQPKGGAHGFTPGHQRYVSPTPPG
jgi:hypothetical protein